MVPEPAGTVTHDYRRNGTLDLFAALNVGPGQVHHDTRRSHSGRDVLAFFRWIDVHVDPDLELHVILDNLSAHKSQPVRDWLADKKRRRCVPRPGHNGSMTEVILRPIQEADLADLCRYSTDPEAAGVFEWTGFEDPKAMRRRWEEDGWLGAGARAAGHHERGLARRERELQGPLAVDDKGGDL